MSLLFFTFFLFFEAVASASDLFSLLCQLLILVIPPFIRNAIFFLSEIFFLFVSCPPPHDKTTPEVLLAYVLGECS